MLNTDELIVTMYKKGIGLKKIADVFEITELDVNRCLSKHGIERIDYIYADRDSKIISEYKAGRKITQIAEGLKVNRHTVTSVLKRSGVYKGNIRANNNSSDKQERNTKIVEYYNSGMSLRQVAQKIGMSSAGINKVLKDLKVQRRPQHMKGHSLGTMKNRKHVFNYDFFEAIDTEEKAYWLGFLYADGYIRYNGEISLALKEDDESHLNAFLKAINAKDTPIKSNKKTKSKKIVVRSVKMARDLSRLGCWQKKSLILDFPTPQQVPKELINHFMRGYFDGDGCIYTDDKNATITILGTSQFLDGYEKELLDNLIYRHKNKRITREDWNPNTQAIMRGGNVQVMEIHDFLYKNATIFLQRKKDIFNLVSSRLRAKSQKP